MSLSAIIVTPVHVVPKPARSAARMWLHAASMIEIQSWLAFSPVIVPSPSMTPTQGHHQDGGARPKCSRPERRAVGYLALLAITRCVILEPIEDLRKAT